ncbi:hypothetical protein YDYSG_28220 [Paenibacillus tyrfis]|nr:hypothetical protein YDYSG_28220 [Paenibacillus tyrfis]
MSETDIKGKCHLLEAVCNVIYDQLITSLLGFPKTKINYLAQGLWRLVGASHEVYAASLDKKITAATKIRSYF